MIKKTNIIFSISSIIAMSILLTSFIPIHDFPGSCNYRIINNNDRSSEKRIVMQKDLLLRYTPKELLAIDNHQHLLNIDIEIERNANQYIITLYCDFYSNKTFRMFGKIKESSQIRLGLLNGSHVYLKQLGNSEVKRNSRNDEVGFTSGFSLNKKDTKSLLKNELENIGIFWESGYESYEVYNMDVFRDQLSCLMKL